MGNSLLFSITDVSEGIKSTLGGALGKGYPLLFNAIGVIAIFLQFMIFQMKHKKRIVFVGILSDIGWLLYFALQGDLISGTANIIGIMAKNIVLLRERHRWAESQWWNIFFVAFAAIFSIFTYQVWMDVFAIAACTLSIIAFFMKNENGIRKVALLSYCAFACNSISKLYVVALIADITALASCIIALLRYKEVGTKQEEEA
jgi:hypothetical protein